MIVLVKMKSNSKVFKKCQIRDRTFLEIDPNNKKIKDGTLKLSDIEGVISIVDGEFKVKAVNDWLTEAQEKVFWKAA